MEERAKALNGQLSNLKDNLKSVAKDFGEALKTPAEDALKVANAGVNGISWLTSKLSKASQQLYDAMKRDADRLGERSRR